MSRAEGSQHTSVRQTDRTQLSECLIYILLATSTVCTNVPAEMDITNGFLQHFDLNKYFKYVKHCMSANGSNLGLVPTRAQSSKPGSSMHEVTGSYSRQVTNYPTTTL